MANVGFSLTPELQQVLADASEESERRGHRFIGTEHLLLALIRMPTSAGPLGRLLAALGANSEQLVARVTAALAREPGRQDATHRAPLGPPPYATRAQQALALAAHEAAELQQAPLAPEHLLLGLLVEGGDAARALRAQGVTLHGARAALVRSAFDALPAEFRVVIDETSALTISDQIVAQVREAVATGLLQPGERLPTIRQLADKLEVAPGTVGRAYAELERLACVVTDGTRGTCVATHPHAATAADRPAALAHLLRPVVVAAFHLGATATELHAALTDAMRGIMDPASDATPDSPS
jgi:DNA-binding transcriptional regulator YhcF (GntR family)